VPESEIQLSIEDDPTPMVLSIRTDLARCLADPGYAELTATIRGTATIREAATSPEAVTATIADRSVILAHGAVDGVQVIATLDGPGGRATLSADAKANHPELAAWVTQLLAPSTDWAGAAERFWAALEPLPGAPAALLVVDLDSGEHLRFGPEGRAYEMRGRAADLTAVLEGRRELIAEAFERRLFIRGSFPEISVLAAAALEVRTGGGPADV
jgi:hypothetical protein